MIERLLVTVGVALLSACAGNEAPAVGSGDEAAVPGGFRSSESVYFAEFAEAVATADLVVVATVVQVMPGRIIAEGTPDEIRHTNTTLAPEATIKGQATGKPLVVETLELAYAPPHEEWRSPGTRVLAFLTKSLEGRPLYITTNHSQSVYILDGEDVRASVRDVLADRVAEWSVSDLMLGLDQAVAKIARGEVAAKERER